MEKRECRKIHRRPKEQVLGRETERLLAVLPENSYVILLDVSGNDRKFTGAAAKIEKLALAGSSHITFVIGGAFGYTDALRHRADERISFFQNDFYPSNDPSAAGRADLPCV